MTRDRACQTPGKMEHYRPDYGGALILVGKQKHNVQKPTEELAGGFEPIRNERAGMNRNF